MLFSAIAIRISLSNGERIKLRSRTSSAWWAQTMRRMSARFAVVAGLCLASSLAQAQNWPTRPVKIVAPFAPGGAADTLGRLIADPLSNVFHQQFYVENRGGAGGLIGSAAVAAAEPDGYTFVVSGLASHVIAPAISP